MLLMLWGPYPFLAGGFAFEELREAKAGRWARHNIIGRRPAGQFTGPGEHSLHLRGTIYPFDATPGASAILKAMQGEAETGKTYFLISGTGSIFGELALEKCQRTETSTLSSGAPMKITYEAEFFEPGDGKSPVVSIWP